MTKTIWTLRKQEQLFAKLERACASFGNPMGYQLIAEYGKDPYLILIACLLSLRARDTVTYPVVQKLFARARTPQELLALPQGELEALVRPLGLYRRKAEVLRAVSQKLLADYAGKVPATEEELLALPGVGRKTANLVLGLGFGIPAICVDVHVHRIAHKLGLVHTKTPEQTERALMQIIPKAQWLAVNRLFVTWGQHHCKPISPERCAPGCPFHDLCPLVYWRDQGL
jgi:endonuclease III